MLETTPVPDDELRFGYFISANGARRPIPAITLPTSPSAYELEWDLSTGVVSIGGTPQGGGIAGFTGDGDLNVSPPRGVLESVVFTNLSTDPAQLIDVAIDELQLLMAREGDDDAIQGVRYPSKLPSTAVTTKCGPLRWGQRDDVGGAKDVGLDSARASTTSPAARTLFSAFTTTR